MRIFEMRCHDAQRAGCGAHVNFRHAARHIAGRGCVPGQDMAEGLDHRQPRQDHIAETLGPSRRVAQLQRRRFDGCEAREQGCERRELIAIRPAVEFGKVIGNFLQAEHVEITHLPRMADDARDIKNAVAAEAPLDVPGDEDHRCLDLRMKVCPSSGPADHLLPVKHGENGIGVAAASSFSSWKRGEGPAGDEGRFPERHRIATNGKELKTAKLTILSRCA